MTRQRTIATLAALVTAIIVACGAGTAKPDFAFPKKVSENASRQLKKAVDRRDGPQTVRALIDLSLAEGAVSNDNLPAALAAIAKTAAECPDGATRAMIKLVEATVYQQIYGARQNIYDSRQTPDSPVPVDYNLWNGNQFRNKITTLTEEALRERDALTKEPLSRWSVDLSYDNKRLTTIYYPTLYDFCCSYAIGLLNELSPAGNILPLRAMAATPVGGLRVSDKDAARVLAIYADWMSAHNEASAPWMRADIERIDYVGSHLWDNGGGRSAATGAALWDLYEKTRDVSEYSGDALIALSDRSGRDRRLWEALKDNLKKYPGFIGNASLRNTVAAIEQPLISASVAECVAPGVAVPVTIEASNVPDGQIDIYRVGPGIDGSVRFNPTNPPAKVGSLAVTTGDEIPATGKMTLTFTFPAEGRYILVPRLDEADQYYQVVTVTRLAVATARYDKLQLWVVDPTDGSPVEGADLLLVNGRSRSGRSLGKTDLRGLLIPGDQSQIDGRVFASKGNDRSMAAYVWGGGREYGSGRDSMVSVSAFTSLPLYHPGDTVAWSTFCYVTSREGRYLAPNRRLHVTMRDANWQTADTATVVTDRLGRAEGRFVIPTGLLNGGFTLNFEENGVGVGSTGFTVSDYKLPTFAIELKNPQPSAGGSYAVRGTARAYSGFPVGDGAVTVDLSVGPRWWWRSFGRQVNFYSVSAETDAAGNFAVTIPGDILDGSPEPNGLFTATVTVTSPSGESRQESVSFMRGAAYQIFARLPRAIDANDAPAIDLQLRDREGNDISRPVSYTVTRGDSTVVSGTLTPGRDVTPDWKRIPSGEVTIAFSAADADTLRATTVVYRRDDSRSPVDATLWTPSTNISAGHGTLLLGVARKTSVLYTLTTSDRIVEQKWIELEPGLHTLSVDAPSTPARLNLSAIADYKSSSLDITVTDARPAPSISLEIESFRDKVTAGDRETWRIRVRDNSGSGREAAVLLDMMNASIAALASPSFAMTPRDLPGGERRFSWNSNLGSTAYYSASGHVKFDDVISVSDPTLQAWGRGWYNYRSPLRMYKTMSRASALGVTEEEVAVDEAKPMYDAAVADLGAAKNDGVSMDSAESTEEAPAAGAVPAAAPAKPEPFSYRQGETALAFFRPMLTTDSEGRLEYSFTVPNANTEWILNALAVTSDVLVAGKELRMTSSKPVMVQPNLPRFVRSGDVIDIAASVMNNGDAPATITTVVETFNPADGKVLSSSKYENTVAPTGAATVTTTLRAPYETPFIGYRIKSSTDGFSDGEQQIIGVMPATTPVIETTPFYIAPDSAVFTMKMPRTPKGARVTLEFTENPTWAVVTALPGLSKEKPSTSPEAAGAIFAAATASGIMRDNPVIRKALEQWTHSDRADSTLTSMLSRNADLKTLLLQATPWMLDAASDTERMTRLSLLFDRGEIDNTISQATDLLARTVRGEGWGWSEGSREASLWATYRVLDQLGQLNALGYMPKDKRLGNMVEKALRYIDDEVVRQYNKYPGGNYTEYVYIRDRFPDVRQSSAASRVSSATVQQVLGRWRDLGVADKARSALILERHNYHATAMTVLESLREYASRSAEKGMWWPSLIQSSYGSLSANRATATVLEAFAAVDPSAKSDIDAIRQWLIMRKETQNWGTAPSTTAVIAAILTTSRRWVAPATGAEINVGPHTVTSDDAEAVTGYLRTTLPDNVGGETLRIVRHSDSPSWGAIYRQYTDTITNIKASACDGLSVTKRILVLESDADGVRAADPRGTLAVGQKVRVELTIKATCALDYVTITDQRPACLEPIDQLPGYVWSEGLGFYRENRDTETRLFIDRLPEGTYILSYDLFVNNAGQFISGIATAQSQYAPAFTAHSAGEPIRVR